MTIFDSHAHYDDARFDEDRALVLSAMPQAGVVGICNIGADLASSRTSVELAARWPFVWAAVGVHPENAAGLAEEDWTALRALCSAPKVVAVGEIGLDYHWEDNPDRAVQKEVFVRQLALAQELDLPVIVHDRDAHEDTMAVLRAFPGVRGVCHCFSGSVEMARELTDRGWYLGFDGPITYKNARKAPEVLRAIPRDRILIETDSPYLTPVPHRGERNDSRLLPYVLETMGALLGISADEAAALTADNARRFYRLDR